MTIVPLIKNYKFRNGLENVSRWALCLPRAIAWILGAIAGSFVAGFMTGWNDVS